MAQFNLFDCLSDNIPGCAMTDTKKVRQAVELSLEGHGIIQDIFLVGILFNKEILLEWHTFVKIEALQMIIRLPVFLPLNQEEAIKQVQKHNKAGTMKDLKEYPYPPDSYILIGGEYPCQLIQEDNELYLKQIMMWGSQKLVQEFMSAITGNLVTATLATIDFYTPDTDPKPQRPQDMVWLTNINDTIGILPLLQEDQSHKFIYLHNHEEVPQGSQFTLNRTKYLVDCDDENGLYIVPQKKNG